MKYKIQFILFFIIIIFSSLIEAQQIVVNELMSSNSYTIADEDRDYLDWFELFNASQSPIDLNGFGISNDSLVPFKWMMPEIILQPQDYILIFASNKNRTGIASGFLHTNFKLSAEGGSIIINDPQGNTVDQVNFGSITSDISYGRYPDGSNSWFLFSDPTPDSGNSSQGYYGITDEPSASVQGGFYSGMVSVNLTAGSPNDNIYYTLDGSEPDETSQIYAVPIQLTSTAVLRARAFSTGFIPSKILTKTYLIDFSTTLPVISLSTNPANLFDDDYGIYVLGNNAQPDFPYYGANYWQDWERPIHAELFETNGTLGFSLDAGIKIYGGVTRVNAQKSFAIYARGEYGYNTLNYKLFNNLPFTEYESFVLRNSGNDWSSTMFRDALMHSMLEGIDIDKLAYRPSVIFINGQYWGIHNIREKINEHFLTQHHNVDHDILDILEFFAQVIQGDNLDYLSLNSFIENNDLAIQSNYESVKTKMEVDEFTRYFVSQIYFANVDWPGGNIKYWRNGKDGKWRWILFDTDWGFALLNPNMVSHNTLELATDPNGADYPNPPWSTLFLRKLLENPSFRNDFINCFADYSNSIFSPSVVISKVDSIKSLIESEIPRHGLRWGLYDLNQWLDNVQELRDFADQRISYMQSHFIQKFGLSGLAQVNLSISDTAMGEIKLNSLCIKKFVWTGTYFLDVPIKVVAQPEPGYRFVKWEGSVSSSEDTLSITLSDTLNLNAVFEADDDTVIPKIVINEINYNSASSFNTEDWIELYNNNGSAVDLSGWIFKDSDDNHIYTLPQGTLLNANGYLVLCIDTTLFKPLFPEVNNFVGNIGFGLSGSGELVRLYDNQMTLIDSLTYDDEAIWPVQPDGAGSTLLLKNPDLDNSLGENWAASLDHGTPGKVNDTYTAVPVELVSFIAGIEKKDVVIRWTTASETNNRGFFIERNITGIWESVHFTPGRGTTISNSSYEFIDKLPAEIENYSLKYRLRQVDFDGSFSYSGVVEIELNLVPGKFQLAQNFPNPFNPSTSIHYTVGNRQFLTLKVFDLLGREIQTLVNEEKPAGVYEAEFDASNLPSGVYFYQLKAGSFVTTKKMILMK